MDRDKEGAGTLEVRGCAVISYYRALYISHDPSEFNATPSPLHALSRAREDVDAPWRRAPRGH